MMVKEKHYAAFIDNYCHESLGVTGVECYRIRCGLVHRGNAAGHNKFDCQNVIFWVPESRVSIHGPRLKVNGKTALSLELKRFCYLLMEAVIKWYDANKNHALVASNIESLLSFRPGGVLPFADIAAIACGPNQTMKETIENGEENLGFRRGFEV